MSTNTAPCDACEELFNRNLLHYCTCGACLCPDCYTEEQHIAHDEEPPVETARHRRVQRSPTTDN